MATGNMYRKFCEVAIGCFRDTGGAYRQTHMQTYMQADTQTHYLNTSRNNK